MGRAALIILIGSIVILGILNMNTVNKLSSATENSIDYNSNIGARNICNTMVEMILARLANDKNYRVTTPETKSFFNGVATYSVSEVDAIENLVDDGGDESEGSDHGNDHSEGDDSGDDHGEGDDGHSNNLKNIDSPVFQEVLHKQINYAGIIFFSSNFDNDLSTSDRDNFNTDYSDGFDEVANDENFENYSGEDDHGEDDHGEDDHGEDDHGEDDHGEDDHGEDDDGEDDEDDHGEDVVDEVDEKSISESIIIKIYVSAELDGMTQTASVYVALPDGGYIPDAIMATITTNNPIETLGSIVVDGRNHAIDGTLKDNCGTSGIWTTSTFTQRGNSTIGGTDNLTDYSPSRPGNASVIKNGQTWGSGSYPTSPDKVLGGASEGFSEGTLKAIAESGEGGSQYVTNPAHLSFPLQGVTYVELASGDSWNAAKITGSGILIVHNETLNAILKNVNTGPFTGLLIADDIIHIHTDIIGAVFGLSPTPSDGNCIGNGSGSILYSSKAIAAGVEDAGGEGSMTTGYGFGKHRLKILAWYE